MIDLFAAAEKVPMSWPECVSNCAFIVGTVLMVWAVTSMFKNDK